jgi:hypothetical protein
MTRSMFWPGCLARRTIRSEDSLTLLDATCSRIADHRGRAGVDHAWPLAANGWPESHSGTAPGWTRSSPNELPRAPGTKSQRRDPMVATSNLWAFAMVRASGLIPRPLSETTHLRVADHRGCAAVAPRISRQLGRSARIRENPRLGDPHGPTRRGCCADPRKSATRRLSGSSGEYPGHVSNIAFRRRLRPRMCAQANAPRWTRSGTELPRPALTAGRECRHRVRGERRAARRRGPQVVDFRGCPLP